MEMTEARVERLIGLIVLALLAAGCLAVLLPFVAPVLWALIFALVSWPAFERLEIFLKGRRTLAATLMILLLVGVMLVPLVVLATSLADDVAGFIQRMRAFFADGVTDPPAWLAGLPLVGERLAVLWREIAEGTISLGQYLPKAIQPVGNWLLNVGKGIGGAVFDLTIGLVTLFFLYRDGREAGQDLIAAARHIGGDRSQKLLDVAAATMKGVVYGTVGTALAQGLLTGIGLAITGVPAATLLGAMAAVFALFPAGPILVWGPAAVWLLAQGQIPWAIFLIAWGGVAVGMSDNVLKPMFIGRDAELHFLLILLGLLGGMIAFGFLGIFLGPTLLAVGVTLVRGWLKTRSQDVLPPTEPETTSAA